ncbi:hypothetical protein ES703_70606 [subsurface metagenome]
MRFCCLDLVGYPLQLLVLKFFLIQCLYLPLSGLVVCLGINGSCGWAGVSSLVLDEPEVLLDVVQPGQISVPEHVWMQLADSSLFADTFYLGIYAAIYDPVAASQDWVAMLQAANIASGEFNPYAVPVGVGLSLLSITLAWVAKRKAAEAAAAQAKYKAHKQGVEKTMKEVSASVVAEVKAVEAELYNNIGEARVAFGIKTSK